MTDWESPRCFRVRGYSVFSTPLAQYRQRRAANGHVFSVIFIFLQLKMTAHQMAISRRWRWQLVEIDDGNGGVKSLSISVHSPFVNGRKTMRSSSFAVRNSDERRKVVIQSTMTEQRASVKERVGKKIQPNLREKKSLVGRAQIPEWNRQ